LRKAHDKGNCEYHEKLFAPLNDSDTIISFNYDLVAERALKAKAQSLGLPFGPWLYALANDESCSSHLPKLLKLHGSSNWQRVKSCSIQECDVEKIKVRTENWDDLDNHPGYRGDIGQGTEFPILLPFWDKQIELSPWLELWRMAYQRFKNVDHLIVWGYSLPPTDIKAQQLFRLRLENQCFRLSVIDPCSKTRKRWKVLFPNADYRGHKSILPFLRDWEKLPLGKLSSK
jgi:hypothetical protein